MKRITTVFLLAALVLSMGIPVSAQRPDTTVTPYYTHVNSVYACISINPTWGIATCSGRVSAQSVTPVKVNVYLQQDTGTYWKTLKSWSATGTWQADLQRDYAVARGYKYRVLVVGYVYDDAGNLLESASIIHEANYS